jgi:hypothetical protein
MAWKDYTVEQIIGLLREAGVRQGQVEKTGKFCSGLGVSCGGRLPRRCKYRYCGRVRLNTLAAGAAQLRWQVTEKATNSTTGYAATCRAAFYT